MLFQPFLAEFGYFLFGGVVLLYGLSVWFTSEVMVSVVIALSCSELCCTFMGMVSIYFACRFALYIW